MPIGINYRNFAKNKFYWIKYSIIHFCTEKCKYNNQLRENNNMSYPYIDIPFQAYIDDLSPDIDHIIKNYIYFNWNTICIIRPQKNIKYIPIFFYFFTLSNIEVILATWVAFVLAFIKASALAFWLSS